MLITLRSEHKGSFPVDTYDVGTILREIFGDRKFPGNHVRLACIKSYNLSCSTSPYYSMSNFIVAWVRVITIALKKPYLDKPPAEKCRAERSGQRHSTTTHDHPMLAQSSQPLLGQSRGTSKTRSKKPPRCARVEGTPT